MTLRLREVADPDLPVFFDHQQDAEACFMAAFTAEDPSDRAAFDAHWAKVRANATVITRTVEVDGAVAGHVASWIQDGQRELTYWLGRDHWGRGLATQALTAFLAEVDERPLFARAAADNAGSIRVLEKCGFRPCGTDRGFAHARGAEIDEVILTLA